MAFQTTLHVPIVDFSPLLETDMKPGTEAWNLIRSQVEKVIVENGCFQLIYPKLPEAERVQALVQVENVLNLPLEVKMKNNVEGKCFDPYFPPDPNSPKYESLALSDPYTPGAIETFTNLKWPQGNQGFSEIITSWANKFIELAEIIRRMILQILGVEKYYDFLVQSCDISMRASRYFGIANEDSTIGLFPHNDQNLFTMLIQSGNGFQACTKSGEWYSALPCKATTLSVVLGDSFHAWSNGKVYSARHRVMMSGKKDRFTLGLFFVPKKGWMVKAPEELVTEEHPLRYKPFDYFDFYQYTTHRRAEADLLFKYAGICN